MANHLMSLRTIADRLCRSTGLAVGLLIGAASLQAQQIHRHEETLEGKIYLSESIAIDEENAGYTLVLPDDGDAAGLIVHLNANRDAGKQVAAPSIEFYALQNNLGLLYITTGNRLEFFFEKAKMDQVDGYLAEVVQRYAIPKQNLFFAGMSLAGTRALKYAVYCYFPAEGCNTEFLKDFAIRAYTEPDVLWWMRTRRKDYYAMNAIDLAGMVNELNLLGNDDAELIVTHDKGYHPDGSRHPHSWSIVDNKELIAWFLEHLK